MNTAARYIRLWGSLGKYTLAREMAFRGNFLIKVCVEVIWLGIMLAFYSAVFGKTSSIAGWDRPQYMFFVGCFFALNGLMEMLFLDNCNEFADLVRTGDLDFLLVRPIDEQFLITCRKIDWGTSLNVPMGGAVMGIALVNMGWQFDVIKVLTFFLTFTSGLLLSYSFMVVLAAISVWLVRNQNLYEMWWLFTSLARYPREIFNNTWAEPAGRFFTFLLPILLVAYVPSNAMVRVLDPRMVLFMLFATAVALWASRLFFFRALRSYRSASS